jgi:hypothetical protein
MTDQNQPSPKGPFPAFAELKDILYGDAFGEVFPPKENPDFLTVDARTAAMRVLRRYISLLQFFRAGDIGGKPIPFRIPEEDIHIEWPDNEVNLRYPSIVFLSQGRAQLAAIGLGTNLIEDSADRFASGTVLQVQNEYTENFAIEIHASKKPERRAILAGLEIALTPTEQMYGIRFTVKEYYDQVCCFSLGEREIFDEADAALNRRRARLYVELRINTVALVNYRRVEPMMKVNVDVDQDTGVPVDLTPPPCCSIIENPDRPFEEAITPPGPADPFNPC